MTRISVARSWLYDRVMWWMLGLGTVLGVAGMLWGSHKLVLGVVVGCLVAVANWRALQWITHRMVAQPLQVNSAMLYVFKFIVLAGVIVLLLYRGRIDALGFALGLSTMVVGILAGNLIHSRPAD